MLSDKLATSSQAGGALGSSPLGTGDMAGSSLLLVSVLLLVLLAAFLTTRFIASRGRSFARGKYLHIKENLFISKDKSIMLLEAGKEYYIIGVSNQSMQLLGRVPLEELQPLPEEPSTGAGGWRGAVARVYQGAKSVASAPVELRKAQAAQREEAAGTDTQQKRGILQLLHRTPQEGQAEAAEAPAEQATPMPARKLKPGAGQPGARKRAGQTGFAENLQAADLRLQEAEDEDDASVIVEISSLVEEYAPVREPGPATEKRKEDEIDRMMQSIEQRTQQLKQRRGKGKPDEER